MKYFIPHLASQPRGNGGHPTQDQRRQDKLKVLGTRV
jgi:hypothetical protein